MPTCSFFRCNKKSSTSSKHKDGVTFHLFPKDPYRRQLWIKACYKHAAWAPARTSTVCSVHFEKSYIIKGKNNKTKLADDAVPTRSSSQSNTKTSSSTTFTYNDNDKMETSETMSRPSAKNICATCLSSDRMTRRMDSASLNAVNDMGLYDGAAEDAILCWECEAFLRRCLLFRRRAEAAHATLRRFVADDNDSTIVSLSSLKTIVNAGKTSYVIVESDDDRPQSPALADAEAAAKVNIDLSACDVYDEVPIKTEPDLDSDAEYAEDPLKPTVMKFEEEDRTIQRPVKPLIITQQAVRKTATKPSAQVTLIPKSTTMPPQAKPKYWMQVKTGNETKNVPILDPAVLKQLESLPKVVTPVQMSLATPVKTAGQNSTVTVKTGGQNAMVSVKRVVQKTCAPGNIIAMTKMAPSKLSVAAKKTGPSKAQFKQKRTPVVIKASSQVNFAELSKILKDKKNLLNQKQNIVLITKVPGKNQQTVEMASYEGSDSVGAARAPSGSTPRAAAATRSASARNSAPSAPAKVQVSLSGVLTPQPNAVPVTKKSAAAAAGIPSQDQAVRLIHVSEETLREQLEQQRRSPFYVNSRFKCEPCIMGYYTRWQLAEHQRHKHVAKPGHSQCTVCTAYIPEVSLAAHERLHRAMFVCVACGFNSRESRRVWTHARTHDPQSQPKPDSLPCADCGKLFPSKKRLRYHKMRHHAERVTCHNCGKSISSECALKAHLRLCLSDREPLQCPQCDKKYLGENYLRMHIRSHTNPPDEKAVKCVECDTLFASEHNYRQHLKYSMKHAAEEKMLKCSECDKKFAVKANLRTHFRYHHLRSTGHVCRVCDKMFATARSVRLHTMYVHERVAKPKDCMCEVCGKSFSATALRHHMAVHSSARPYVCRVCGDTFRQGAALYTHTKLKHLKQKRKPSAKRAAQAADT